MNRRRFLARVAAAMLAPAAVAVAAQQKETRRRARVYGRFWVDEKNGIVKFDEPYAHMPKIRPDGPIKTVHFNGGTYRWYGSWNPWVYPCT